jgi:MFS family permease
MSYKKNNLKNAIHGFFLSIATTVAEPSTIMPLIVHHFTQNLIVVGLFTSLLRGGAIVIQLVAAFYAQSFERTLKYLKIVFLFRFLAWFGIGVVIYLFGDSHPTLTLWLIGIGLFLFSFSAGFGGIYFKEIIAKVFDSTQRGRTMANRQLFSSIGAVLSGGVAGWVLSHYEAPKSYSYLFLFSSILMVIGFLAFATIDEPSKQSVSKRESSFFEFLQNAYKILKQDRALQIQIAASLLGYSFLLAMPFVIIQAKESINLSGWLVGSFITIQMIGSILGNFFLWRNFGSNYVLMLKVAFLFMILAFLIALFFQNAYAYSVIFFLFGVGIDGFRNADMNLVIEIAPEDKRPVYVAIQSTIVSLGLFFSIPGGLILELFGYRVLYITTILALGAGVYFTSLLKKYHPL